MSVSSLRSLAGRTSCGPRWRSGPGVGGVCMLTGGAGCRRGAGSLTPLTPAQVRVPRAVGCPGPVGRFGKSSRIELGLEE